MGALMDKRLGGRHSLPGEAIVGRSSRADLVLAHDFVSGLHAMLRWTGSRWELKDLGSRNGTAVNGRAVPSGSFRRLRRGDEIAFGQVEATWVLSDDSPPEAIAVDDEGHRCSGANGLLAIPNEEEASATVYWATVGRWCVETTEGVSPTTDGAAIDVDGTTWTLHLPAQVVRTRSARGRRSLHLADVALTLHERSDGTVSVETSDEELESFVVGAPGRLLCALVQTDRAAEDGWVEREDLLDDLRIRAGHLNVFVYRLRRSFADAGFIDAIDIIERDGPRIRLGTKQIRVAEITASDAAG